MSKKAPGRADRKGITLAELFRLFPDDATAEKWFAEKRWGDNGIAHTNGIESFRALLKRGYHGTCHKMSEKHPDRYVNEFAGRHNIREPDTIDQMNMAVRGFDHRRLKYSELIADNGLVQGAGS